MNLKGKNKLRKLFVGAFALVASFATGATLLFGQSNAVYANENTTDASTAMGFQETFNNNSTQYSGRIWTDKSVDTNTSYGNHNFAIEEDEDFLVTFSALSSTQTVRSETASPIDVVFVLDFSASMTWGVNSTTVSNPRGSDSRIKYLVDSLNNAIDTLVNANDNNRIGIVTFNRVGSEFMGLTSAAEIKNKNIQNKQYLELTEFSGTHGQDNGQSTVTNHINGRFRNTDSKTNIQFGLNEAMQMLNDVLDTTVTIDGKEVQRIPNVVLMSDGAPTTISESESGTNHWWDELDYNYKESINGGDSIGWGDNERAWSANGMLPMMTASYMKEVITDKYFKNNTDNQSMNIYTIGFSTNYQTDQMVELANLVLDPVNNFDKAQNSRVNEIRLIYDAWNRYLNNRNATVHYVEESNRVSHDYDLDHPNTGFDIDTLKYNTAYYAAEDSDSLNDAFNSITNSMIDQGKAPTEVTGSVTNSGYITFVDTLGDYMEVKNVKGLVIGNQFFEGTYENGVISFTGHYSNNIYGSQNLANLKINVTVESGRQVLTMQIPASLIPLVLDTIDLDAAGQVTNQEEASMYPMRLIYSVGLKNDILKEDGSVDLTKINQNYINAHKDAQGNVLFFSNYFDNTNQSLNKESAGNAYVEYEPALENEYYFLQDDTPIFLDENGQVPVTSFDSSASYYVPFTYYQNGQVVTTYELRSASVMEGYTKSINGNVYLEKGAPRLGNISEFTNLKTGNETATAETSYAPTFVYRQGGNDPKEGVFHVYLGNNGQLKVPAASLTIEKAVVTNDETIQPTDQDFTFQINLENNNQFVEAEYIILDKEGNPVMDPDNQPVKGTISEQNNQVTIKKDQKIQFNGLYAGTTYEVNEINVTDPYSFKEVNSTSSNTSINESSASGQLINDDKAITLTYTNKYETSLDVDINGTKTITGREFQEGDEFTFVLSADQNNPEGATVNTNEIKINPTSGNTTNIVSEDAITFTKTGVYTFYLSEDTPDQPEQYMEYDTTEYKLVYTVDVNETGDGFVVSSLSIQTKQDDGSWIDASAVTFNNKYNAPVTTAVDVLKTLTGRDWTNDDAFTFTLASADDYGTDVIMPQSTKLTINKDTADHKASFDAITFNKEGTYTFNINEVIPEGAENNVLNGITYDSTPSTVSVTVSDNDQGQLIIEKVVYDNDENLTAAEFTNTYSATGTTSIEVTKDLKGRNNDEWIDGDAFTFTLASTQDYGADVVMPQSTTLTIDKDTVDHKASFGDITFNKAGDYEFKVTEVNDSKANVTYSTEEYTVSVHVEDENGNGTFTVTPTITNGVGEEVESIVFENTYTPSSVTLTGDAAIHGTKTLIGRNSNENETFNFTLTEDDKNDKSGYLIAENGNVASVGSLTDGQASGFNFGDITFTKRGTYTFYVSEVLPEGANESNGYTLEGVTYDNHKETVTVTVTDDYMNNTLVPTVTYDADGVVFTNKYDAAEFDGIPTDFTLTKVFEGKEWSTEDVFEFTLTAGENTAGIETPMPANPTVQVNAPTEKDGKTANFDFGSISYDTVGEYHYTVSETEGTNAGIKYSKNVAEITVTVTDNKQGGLAASAEVIKGTFTNTYSSELDYVGKGGIELVKNLIGYDLTKDNQFTFTLSAADEASKEKAGMQDMSEDVFNTEDTMDANGLSTSTIQLLPKMQKFTQDDVGKVYKYTVSETSEQKPGYTNDTTEYTIQISTSDDGSGTLTVSTRITGTNGTDITYEYTQSKQKAETGVAQVVFNNTYTSSTQIEGYDGSVNLTGTKTLTNRPMVANEFNFQVIDNKGNEISTGTNTADGTVAFTPINYTNTQLIQDHANGIASKDGNTYTYVYDVKEVTPQDPGTTIVAGEFSVTVEVTDNGDGKLTTNVIYPETGLAFENAYGQSANAELNIHGTKKLAENGTNHPDITGKFQFTITGSDGAPMPEQTTVTNDASGNINFGKIVYTMQNVFGDDGQQTILEEEPVVDQEMPIAEEQTTEDGTVSEDVVGLTEQVETYSEKREKTFTYTITESGSLPGVTNDSAKVINVKVIDNGDGTISVTSDTQGTFTFVNTYVPDPTDETSPTDSAVTIKKVLDGRTLKADEFSFTMMDENGNGVQATNAEDGSVVFPKLTFDKEGIYTYTISETNDNKGGVNYDTTTYKAIATVTDDTSGKLKVEWKVTDAQGKEINEITFNNKYTVQPTSLTLGATKVLEGRELADKEFLFVLSDEEGNVVEEAYNDKTGKVTFSDLTFDKAGTYNYTVTEKNTNAKGITYDESVYNIQVEVVDNEDGTLNMTTTTTKDGEVSSIVFRNKAEKDSVPEQPEKGDTSNTSTRTFAGLFTSLAVDAAALAGIATLLKKRNAKK